MITTMKTMIAEMYLMMSTARMIKTLKCVMMSETFLLGAKLMAQLLIGIRYMNYDSRDSNKEKQLFYYDNRDKYNDKPFFDESYA